MRQHIFDFLPYAHVHLRAKATRPSALQPPSGRPPIAEGGLGDEQEVPRFALRLRLGDRVAEVAKNAFSLAVSPFQPAIQCRSVDATRGRRRLYEVPHPNQVDDPLGQLRVELGWAASHRGPRAPQCCWLLVCRILRKAPRLMFLGSKRSLVHSCPTVPPRASLWSPTTCALTGFSPRHSSGVE